MRVAARSEKRRTTHKAHVAAKPSAGKSRQVSGSTHQKSADPRAPFSDDEWYEMVATAAYFRAESRGFEGGSPEDDWYEAEAELRERMAAAEREDDPNESPGSNQDKGRTVR